MTGARLDGNRRLHTSLGRARARAAAPALPLGCALAICSFSTRVAAQDPQRDELRAQVLFDEARALFAAGQLAEACPKLAESQKLDPAIGTLFYLAECLERSGKSASAWRRYREVADMAASAGQTAKERFARARADRLSPELHRLAVTVPEAVRTLPGLRIELDGVTLAAPEWGAAIAVDPGVHEVRVAADRKKPWSVTRSVETAGETVTVEIPPLENRASADPLADVQAPASGHYTTSIPFAPTGSTRAGAPGNGGPEPRIVGALVLGGAGVAGLIAGGILGGLALGEKESASAHCQAAGTGVTDCTAPGIAATNRARDLANGSTVSFSAGALLIGAGAAIYLLFPAPSTSGQTRLGLSAGNGGFVLEATGTWE